MTRRPNADGSDETEDDDVDNNPGSNPEAEAAVGGVAGGGTAVDSAVAEMRQEIMEIIQGAMANPNDAEYDLLMHIVTEVGRDGSRMYRQIVTNVCRPEASRMSAASLYMILEKIGKREMKREGLSLGNDT